MQKIFSSSNCLQNAEKKRGVLNNVYSHVFFCSQLFHLGLVQRLNPAMEMQRNDYCSISGKTVIIKGEQTSTCRPLDLLQCDMMIDNPTYSSWITWQVEI